ncbi:alpha-amylase 3 [Actinomyces sp. oral taxon 448 str. F0400]|nr:alpha-amylase 3 [Actinomyces sp. oral taxon 448 str. F0400]
MTGQRRAARSGGEGRDRFRFDDAAGGEGGPGYATFEGRESLAALNHDSAEVRDLAVRVLTHWLDRGASAWRLDAAYGIDPAFWASVLPAVRERHPDAWFMGEVIHGDYTGFVEASTVDTVAQYELWKAIWSSLADVNFYELDWCLGRHNELLESFIPATFVGNHDVTRIASKVGAAKAALAVVLLMTVGGVPSVYYGDEQGQWLHVSLSLEPTPRAEVRAPDEAPLVVEPPAQ